MSRVGREIFRAAFPEYYHEPPHNGYHGVKFTHGATVYLTSDDIHFIGNYGKFPNGTRLGAYVDEHHSHHDTQGFHIGYEHADRLITILRDG